MGSISADPPKKGPQLAKSGRPRSGRLRFGTCSSHEPWQPARDRFGVTRPHAASGIRTEMTRPQNGTLRAATRNDPGRLRTRTRQGERRKQMAARARRKAVERRALAAESTRRV